MKQESAELLSTAHQSSVAAAVQEHWKVSQPLIDILPLLRRKLRITYKVMNCDRIGRYAKEGYKADI
jgi:hypothetical protein